MKLEKIRIRNLRCISDVSFNIGNYLTLVGANNAGKSTCLRAISILVDQEIPEIAEWHRNVLIEPIEIEGTFGDIQEWERDIAGVSGTIQGGKIHLKVVCSHNPEKNKVELQYYSQKRAEDIRGWSDSWPDLSQEIKDLAASLGITNGTNFRNVANKERVKEEIRTARADLVTLGELSWGTDGVSINSALKQALPKVVFIPAMSTLDEQMKTTGSSPFNQLLQLIIIPEISQTVEFQNFQQSLQQLVMRMGGGEGVVPMPAIQALSTALSDSMAKLIDGMRVKIALDSPDTVKLLAPNAYIKIVSNESETPAELQGHGAQRALVFAMLEELARMQRIHRTVDAGELGRTVLLLFEEPELYIHPQLIRKLKNALKALSDSGVWQIVTTTHSPVLVDVSDDVSSLVLLRKDALVNCYQVDRATYEATAGETERSALRAALDFHPTVAECFFAKEAILVEGDSEVAFLRRASNLAQRIGCNAVERERAFISCGGKWTILGFVRILNTLNVPYKIIHDADIGGRTEEDLAVVHHLDPYNVNQRIAEISVRRNIFQVNDSFENVFDLPGAPFNPSGRDKPYKVWKKTNELVDNGTDILPMTELCNLLRFIFSAT